MGNDLVPNGRVTLTFVFFITDCIKDGKLTIEYCPIEHILADVFTKLLQGSAFRKFHDAILNCPPGNADPSAGYDTDGSQGCVAESSKTMADSLSDNREDKESPEDPEPQSEKVMMK
jgi:hypothetical protein